MKTYKDCELKGRILHCIANDRNTSRAIYAEVQHPSYPAFKSELNQLKRRGYITISNDKRPYLYTLTKKGRLHATDPYISIKRKQENIQLRVDAILTDSERFKEAVNSEVQSRLPGISSPSSQIPSYQSDNPHHGTAHFLEELKSKDLEIARLQYRVQELTRTQTATRQQSLPTTKTPEEQKQEQERVQRRQKLANMYASQRRLLDYQFFRQWGDMWPYRMKHLQLFKSGSVEIMSTSNPEHARGHTRGTLNEGGIIGAGFFIKQIHKDGIIVHGKGMTEDKLLRW
jgi:predicted transcriptional regulator